MASSGAKTAAAFLVVFFFISHAYAYDKCTAGCHGASQPKDGFIQGNTYAYSLEGVASIHLSGAHKQETTVKLTAQATVVALGNCANLLKVTSLQITGNDGTKYNKPRDIEKPVRFTLQDGVLGSDICAEDGDSQKSLNIKRALLSLLQTATKHNTEVDVFGICPTTFTVNKDGANGVIVRKNRDLNICAHREQGKQDLLSYIYNPHSEIKNSHIMQSDMRVNAVLKKGIVEKVDAQEDYLYRPFSAGQAGAKASVTTKLVLKETSKGTLPSKCVVPKSIIFENPHLVNTDHSNLANLQLALNSATQALNGHVQDKSAAIFANLIKVFRVSSKEDILNIYGQIKGGGTVKDNNLAKKVFLDALFRAGTGDSIEVSINLLQNKELTPLQQKLVLISLTTVRHASSNSLKAATTLLDVADLPNELFLGVGALAGAYCREHPCHGPGSQDAGVAAVSAKLASKIGDCKAGSKKAEDMIISALKGLRNIHHLEDSVVDKLAHCAADKTVNRRVRVAALETFAADACIPKLKSTALEILKDTQQDSELRIKAYLALLECPCANVAGELKTLLDSEPVYQVGSYITSSLRNIRASTNPARESAKQYFSAIKISNKYPLDARKYSQNYEASYEVETLGVGSVVEGNVIYSQDSFLPRSANLNLTAEIFGRQINLIELGMRQGNLDRVIEEFFGPHGVIKSHTPQELFNEVKETTSSIIDKIQERLHTTKTKRDVQKQIAAFGDKLKTDAKGYRGNLDLDVFVKLFGIESVFLSLGDGEHPVSVESLIDRVFDFVDSGISEAKQFSHEVRNHVLFLDMELAYPTSSGMALKLNLEGAATSKLNFGGNFDIKKILNDPKNAKVEIKIVPSANIEISGTLSIDADVVVHGLKVIGTLHTSTGSHLVFKMLENGFDLQFGLPVEKQEIITASNEIFFYKREKGHQDVDTKVTFDTGNWKQYSGCFDQLSDAVGLTFCGEVSVPWNDLTNHVKGTPAIGPLFPLNGQAKLAINLEKDDLKGFHVHGGYTVNGNGQRQFKLGLEAEGATKKDRKVSFLVEQVHNQKVTSIKAVLDSPKMYYNARAALAHSEQETSISAGFNLDHEDYNFKAGIEKVNADTFKPLLEYTLPDKSKPLSLEGTITSQPGSRKFTLNNVCLVLKNDRITLNGYVALTNYFESDLKLAFGDHKASLRANLKESPNGLNGDAEFHNTLNPSLDILFNFELVASEDTCSLDVTLVHGPDSKSKENKLSFYACITGDLEQFHNYDLQTKLSYPIFGISFNGKSEANSKKFELDLDAAFQGSQAEFELELKRAMKKEQDLSAKIQAKLDDKGFKAECKYEAESDIKGSFSDKLEIYHVGKYELSGTVTHKLETEDFDFGVDAKFKSSESPDECRLSFGVACNPNNHNSHLKLSRGSTDYVDALLKIAFEPTHGGSVKVIVKDIVDAQGQFKVNADHKGNALLVIELVKTHRKLKLESTFLIADPQYNIAIDIFPDFGKDNSQKVSFTTITKNTDGFFESKNGLTINGDKTEVHIKNEASGELRNGKNNVLLEISRPNGKTLNVHWQREVITKGDDVKGTMESDFAYVSEKGAHPVKLTHKGRLINMNKKTGQAEGEHHVYIVTGANQDLDLKLAIKIVPKNQRKNIDVKFEATGAICKDNIVYTSNVDYYDGETDDQSDAKYRIKGSYGQKSSVDITGSYSLSVPDEADGTFNNDVNINLVLPLDKAHDIKLSSVDHLVIPHADDKYIEFTSKKSVQVNANTYKYEAALQLADHDGKLKVAAQVPKQDNFVLESSYSCQEGKDNTRKFNSAFNVDYGTGKQLQLTVGGTTQEHEGDFTITAALPDNLKAKHIVTNIKYKKPETRSFSSDVNVDVDGKKYTLTSEVDLSQKDSSVIDIKANCPNSSPARVYIKAQKTGEHQYKGISKLEHLGDFNLDMTIDAKLIAPENFDIKVDVDSAKLKLNKVHFAAKSETADKGAKKIQFSAKENGKDVLSGLTTFQSRQEGSKFIMEGSGNVKVKGEQKTTSFKYIRDILHEKSENGVEVFFNVALGEKNIVIEHKATNQEYKLSSVYCEEKKQCAHIDINNKLDTSVPNRLSQKLEFGFDLRKLGFAPEFGLQTSTELERFKLPVHTLDIHLSQDKSKYHAQVFAKPVKGVYQTAVMLTTPQRVISLESATSVPESQSKNPFPITHETVFFLNKNDPGSRTQLKLIADFQRAEHKQVSTNGEISFSCPSLGKDLQVAGKAQYDVSTHTVSSELVLDIFKKKAQKVVITFKLHPELVRSNEVIKSQISYEMEGHVNGKGLGFDILLEEKFFLSSQQVKLSSVAALTLDRQRKAFSLLLDASPSKQNFVLSAPSVEILRVEGSSSHNAGQGKVDLTICALGDKTYRASGELSLNSPYSVSLVAGLKDSPAKVVVSGKAEPMKAIEVKADHFDGRQNLPLASFSLDAHNNNGKPTFNIDSKQIKQVLEKTRADLTELATKGEKIQKQQNDQTVKDFHKLRQTFQSASPDFSNLLTSYQKELQKISEELKSDKALQQLTDTIQKVFVTVSKVVTEITDKLSEIFKQTYTAFTDFLDTLQQVWTDKLLPSLTSLIEKVSEVVVKILDEVLHVASQVLVYFAEFVEKNTADLKPVLENITKVLQEFYSVFESKAREVLEMTGQFFQNLSDSFGDLSIVQNLKDKLEEYDVPATLHRILDEVLHRCHGLSPTEELKAFFNALIAYVDKVFNAKKVNELEELKVIFSKFVPAVDSLVAYLRGTVGANTPNVVPGSFVTLPSFGGLTGLPSVLPPKFSILNFFQEETNINPEQIVRSYWPKSLNPLDLLPPYKLRGLIAGGQHIFTFDNRHITFPGNCRYFLAHDAVDGNFSIVVNLEKGAPKSVALWDKSGNIVEVNDKTQLTLNDQKYGFPVIKSDIVAWKDGQTFVIQSQYGAFIKCSYNLDLCYVEVSGFYLGKLRGLLGDGNNEPYDDFRLPSGQICTSESEFGNAYAMSPSCPQVKTVDHSDHHGHHGNGAAGGICSNLFGEKSVLRVCDLSVGIKNFRQACQHATMSGGPKTNEDACLIAKAYTLACHASGIPVPLPSECATCQVDGTTYHLGQEFKVKTPQKQADILVAVETTTANEKTFKELVLPLVSAFVDELKTKKIDDVRVQLVGISPKLRYPIYYDTENAKLKGNKIDFKDEQRSSDWESPITTDNENYDMFLEQIATILQSAALEFGVDNLHLSYSILGKKMQWRPKAVKSILMVHSEPCSYANIPIIQFLGECVSQAMMEDEGIVAHLITPVEELTAEVKNKDFIIGFSSNQVFVLGDKKRGLSHSNLRDGLEYGDDQCVSYAEETFGNVYSSKNFFALNPNQKKNFIQLASHTLVDSLAAVTIESECSCGLGSLTPTISCSVQNRKDNKKGGSKK